MTPAANTNDATARLFPDRFHYELTTGYWLLTTGY
jgi:hypothetical protein